MSPVPPPGGFISPSDDWSNDASFDLSSTAQTFTLSSSPSSPSSSTSSPPTSRFRQLSDKPPPHTSSPLRHAHPSGKSRPPQVEDEDDFEFDLPDSFPALASPRLPNLPTPQRSRNTTASSSSSIRNLPSTVIGSGPAGIGTVTRLGAKGSKTPSVPTTAVLARAKALEQTWENDVDFDSLEGEEEESPQRKKVKPKRLTLSPPKPRIMPGPDALDDIDFDMDDDEATLKAGATIKALLPPPRHAKLPLAVTTPVQDDELEGDFVLPLSLTNLTLATQSHDGKVHMDTVKPSKAGWDSPTTSTTSGKKSMPWSDDSPKRKSDTSFTSISGTDSKADAKTDKAVKKASADDTFDEIEDMEEGLVIPSATFFSSQRADELNKILDKKRRPQNATPQQGQAEVTETLKIGDESVEDGLVLDNPRTDLTRKRLHRTVKARAPTLLPKKSSNHLSAAQAISGIKDKVLTTPASQQAREKAWEKQREQGWGRYTPAQPGARERTQSSVSGLGRSQSSGTTSLKDLASGTTSTASTARSLETPTTQPTSRDNTLSRARLNSMANLPSSSSDGRGLMAPPPLPITPATTGRSLRHQKSHYHMPSQSPSLARKPSLASLQDAMATSGAPPLPQPLSQTPVPPLPQSLGKTSSRSSPPEQLTRYHNSTSRLTMPTSSSRAKTRPALHNVFPRSDLPSTTAQPPTPAASSAGRVQLPRSKSGKGSWPRDMAVPKTMDMPKKPGKWDGTELDGIEDMPVERTSGSLGRNRGKKGRSLPMTAGFGADKKGTVHDTIPPSSSSKTPLDIELEQRKLNDKRQKPKTGRKMPALISHKGRNDKVIGESQSSLVRLEECCLTYLIVVGDMTFNPRTQRWEGNEALLRDFDPPNAPSVRPALITHYTGSSTVGVKSPSASATATVRIVGNMMFDPEKMCWVSILPPEEEEPDPFAGMADDEDEDAVATITRASGRKLASLGSFAGITGISNLHQLAGMGHIRVSQSSAGLSSLSQTSGSHMSGNSAWSSRLASTSQSSLFSWEDRMREDGLEKIPDGLVDECKEAEERHKREMRGWVSKSTGTEAEKRDKERREEKRLWEIRVLATT